MADILYNSSDDGQTGVVLMNFEIFRSTSGGRVRYGIMLDGDSIESVGTLETEDEAKEVLGKIVYAMKSEIPHFWAWRANDA
jgi:hypothetical protein